jgi:hypothetical protein
MMRLASLLLTSTAITRGFQPHSSFSSTRHSPLHETKSWSPFEMDEKYAALKADGEVTIAERERVQAAYEQEIKVQRLKAEGDATVAKRRAMEEVYK